MKVLVCGGRDYDDGPAVMRALDAVHGRRPITLVIEGGARGADRHARNWALTRNVPFQTFEADWTRLGNRAGPSRNLRMLNEGRPDLVVAFPGGKGTAHMIRSSEAAGVPVYKIGLT